ncbi:subtilisin inhibitor-like [Halopolyspora algeriensis]|uniref:Subtilisin inhibitor-like n=1 Tax=Halopolyspora algeriensis TaxID=1500506 RepID=A0A368VTG5_9ACTN|nr:SSI family serine proteinase inhibitor [Halopolyspora algeriensis]RCW45302.1 subtilisin inhibitor-like [Halopolyspora algeriensis]TQM47342.1 subtilisin inhibitor-like [Halopolyspora algeriensis]
MAATRSLGRALLAATAVFAATLAPAGASAQPPPAQDSAPAAPRPSDVMRLTVDSATGSGTPRSVVLACHPSGGTHPRSAAACAALSKVDGKFENLRKGRANGMCTMIYKPITVTATGTWKGTTVKYDDDYPNACVLTAHTGPVFDF